jgi:hypothetical protein
MRVVGNKEGKGGKAMAMATRMTHRDVGSYKLPLLQYTCIGQVVAFSFQQRCEPRFKPLAVQAPGYVNHVSADATHIVLCG